MQNSILEKTKVAERDYMLQFPKELELYRKLVSKTMHSVLATKFMYDYLCITIIYKSIFTAGTSH